MNCQPCNTRYVAPCASCLAAARSPHRAAEHLCGLQRPALKRSHICIRILQAVDTFWQARVIVSMIVGGRACGLARQALLLLLLSAGWSRGSGWSADARSRYAHYECVSAFARACQQHALLRTPRHACQLGTALERQRCTCSLKVYSSRRRMHCVGNNPVVHAYPAPSTAPLHCCIGAKAPRLQRELTPRSERAGMRLTSRRMVLKGSSKNDPPPMASAGSHRWTQIVRALPAAGPQVCDCVGVPMKQSGCKLQLPAAPCKLCCTSSNAAVRQQRPGPAE